jgi:LemA protein
VGFAIFLFFVVVVGLCALFWSVSTRNRFAQLGNLVQESWRQVDVELVRRHDLIPNLVETVKAHARFEAGLLEGVAAARAAALQARTPGQLSGPESALGAGVRQVLAVSEAYPQLRASESFLRLQAELVNCEDRIAAGRRFYNANVRALNTLLDSYPANLLADGRPHAEYFIPDSPSYAAVPQVGS